MPSVLKLLAVLESQKKWLPCWAFPLGTEDLLSIERELFKLAEEEKVLTNFNHKVGCRVYKTKEVPLNVEIPHNP